MKRYLYVACVWISACEHREPAIPEANIQAPVTTPTTTLDIDPSTVVHEGDGLSIEVALSDGQLCLRLDGLVYCGSGDDKEKALASQPAVENVQNATSIAAGYGFACAVANGGQVWCWGSNTNGELGAELTDYQVNKAVRAKGIEKAKRVFAGTSHVCAVLENGEVFCWGNNMHGQTGSATFYDPRAHDLVVPTAVPGIKDAAWGAANSDATCVSTKSKDVICWGQSVFQDQQDANGEQNEKTWKATNLHGIEQMSSGERAFCGIKGGSASELLCWGESYSLFADYRGKTKDPRSLKVPEPKRVRLSASHACALSGDSRVYCWGAAYSGALGRDVDEKQMASGGTQNAEPVPELRAIDIAVGGSMSCAITRDKELFCWGRWPYASTGQRFEKTPVAMRVR